MNAGPPEEGQVEAAPPMPDEPASEAPPPPPSPEAPASQSDTTPAKPPSGRGITPVVAIAGIVIILVIAVGGYSAAGYEYARGRISKASTAYNAVIDHENKYADALNSFTGNVTNADINSATPTDLQQKKTTVTQLVDTSTQAQSQVVGDDAILAKADIDLKQNSWLTAIDRSEIDKTSTRIGHMRKALADAKALTADYVQLGTFYESFYDVVMDEVAVADALNGSNNTAIGAAVTKIEADLTKAMSLDKSQGVVADYDGYLKDLQTVVNDLSALIDAAGRQDSAAADAANTALQKDATKLDSYDFAKMDTATQAFFAPLLQDYNSEINKANNT